MLKGEKVLLRAVERGDVEVLGPPNHDPAEWPLVSEDPWLPRTLAQQQAHFDDVAGTADDSKVLFTIEVDGEPVGHIGLHRVDLHNRRATLGIGLVPPARGKGYGSDAIRVLLRYAFVDRGLRRVGLTLLADNAPALRAYEAAGFVPEGRLRDDAWVSGRWVDQLVMSVVATDPAARS